MVVSGCCLLVLIVGTVMASGSLLTFVQEKLRKIVI